MLSQKNRDFGAKTWTQYIRVYACSLCRELHFKAYKRDSLTSQLKRVHGRSQSTKDEPYPILNLASTISYLAPLTFPVQKVIILTPDGF